ncbi:MAG: hypothetical protein AAFZ15_34145 [Bacteroidota bacterium]
MKKLLIVGFSILFVCSCKTEAPNNADELQQKNIPAQVEKPMNKNTIAENKKIAEAPSIFEKTVLMGQVNFNVSAENKKTTTVKVNCDGLAVRKYKQEFTVKGQIINAFGLDLDKDGFHELYLAIRRADGSGDIELIGIASYNDKSAGEITINDIKVSKKENTDKVYAFYGELKREFYDQNNQLQVYSYQLKKGEAGFILEPARTK